MDLKQLKYFTAVAELGSYTRAAEVINVAQPVLSRQIRQLEVELRQNLLMRHGRGVVLTDAGETLLKHSRIILQQLDQAQEDLSLKQGKIRGHVVIGIPPTLARLLSLDLVKAFKKTLPHASLTVVESLTVNIEEQLNLGRIDIGILYNPNFSPNIQTECVVKENLFLITQSTNPVAQHQEGVALDKFKDIPLIIPSFPNSFRVLIEKHLAEIGIQANIALEIDSITTILELVEESMGNAVLTQYATQLLKQSHGLVAIPIINPSITSEIHFATSNKRTRTQIQTIVLDMIKQLTQRKFYEATWQSEEIDS